MVTLDIRRDERRTDVMEQSVTRIALFTVKACPIGRNMGHVCQEIAARYPDIQIGTYYVEDDIDETNRYRIKRHPTVLFLDQHGKELYRAEGFTDTDEVARIIEQIRLQKLPSTADYDENAPVVEKYTIYLYRDGVPMPVDVEYNNATGVRAPRITAVRLLLTTRPDHYENPFPEKTTLELIQFEGTRAVVHLRMRRGNFVPDREKMKRLLQKTLAAFGIEEVQVEMGDDSTAERV